MTKILPINQNELVPRGFSKKYETKSRLFIKSFSNVKIQSVKSFYIRNGHPVPVTGADNEFPEEELATLAVCNVNISENLM